MVGVHGGLVVFKIARSSFVDRLLRFTGKRWFELGGVDGSSLGALNGSSLGAF